VLFTDGIIEAESDSGMYGLERLISHVESDTGSGASLIDQILSSVEQFVAGRPIRDDLTIVVADL
jgi:serine phosphatase RsbU (regulator of sigma subunit)